MNRITYYLLALLFVLPLSISAQEEITIIENSESQIVTGTVVTVSNNEKYINTETNLYQVTNENTILLGDVNKDEIIDVTDAIIIVDMVMNDEYEYSKIADINEDESVDVTDAIIVIDIVFEEAEAKYIIESYEVEDITNVWIKSSTATAVDQH